MLSRVKLGAVTLFHFFFSFKFELNIIVERMGTRSTVTFKKIRLYAFHLCMHACKHSYSKHKAQDKFAPGGGTALPLYQTNVSSSSALVHLLCHHLDKAVKGCYTFCCALDISSERHWCLSSQKSEPVPPPWRLSTAICLIKSSSPFSRQQTQTSQKEILLLSIIHL